MKDTADQKHISLATNTVTSSIASSLFAVGIALLYVWARLPLGINWQDLVKSLGTVLFLNSIPVVLSGFDSRNHSEKAVKLTVLTLSSVIVLAAFGYYFGDLVILSTFITILGGLLFYTTFIFWLSNNQKITKLLLGILFILFGMWLGAGVWTQGSLSPFLWEKIAYSSVHSDTLFQVTLAAMLKNYHQVSTGLDGLVPVTYHFGSNLLFAGLSHVLDISTLQFYELSYPIIFLPLLFHVLLTLVTQLQAHQSPKEEPFLLGWFFWLLFCSIFVGVTPLGLTYKLSNPPLLFFSESYVVGMLFLLGTVFLILPLLRKSFIISSAPLTKMLYGVGIVGLSIITGIIKISNLYLLVGALWFLLMIAIVKKIFSINTIIVLLVVLSVFSILSFYLYTTLTFPEHSTSFYLFHYFSEIISLKLLPVWAVFGIPSILASLSVLYYRYQPRTLKEYLSLFEVQLLLFLVCVGLLPSLLFNLGPNGNYFIDPVRWVATLLLLRDNQVIHHLFQQYFSSGRTLTRSRFIPVVLRIIILLMLILVVRNSLATVQRFKVEKNTVLASAHNSPEIMHQLAELKAIGESTHDSKSAIYIVEDSPFWKRYSRCRDESFIATSLAEQPLFEGSPDQECTFERYGYAVYEKKARILDNGDKSSLCAYALNRGFTRVTQLNHRTTVFECLEK